MLYSVEGEDKQQKVRGEESLDKEGGNDEATEQKPLDVIEITKEVDK
jgi:hypothetical protein